MLLVGGENLFDLISDTAKDELTYKAVPGGSPYNTAIAAGKLGAHTAYISPVSKDKLGQSLLDHLAQAQVLDFQFMNIMGISLAKHFISCALDSLDMDLRDFVR